MTLWRINGCWRRWFVYGGVTLLVILALALTSARLLLPYAKDYRGAVEAAVSRYLDQPVRIGAMQARLRVLSPTLVLQDVSLFHRTSGQPIAQFREIELNLGLTATLLSGAPVLDSLTVVGASLGIERRVDGSFRVTGLAMAEEDGGDPEALSRWILSQGRLALRDAHVVWIDRRTDRRFEFHDVAAELRNDGSRHRLSGSVRLPRQWGGVSQVALDLEGDPLAMGGVRGRVYVNAANLRPVGLLRELPVPGLTARGGELSVELWGEWDGWRLHGLQGRLHGRRLAFSGAQGDFDLDDISARLSWVREAKGWHLDVADFLLVRGGRSWEPAHLRVDLALTEPSERRYRLQASFLRIEDMAAIAGLVPAGKEWKQSLEQWAPRGDLRHVRVEYATSGVLLAGAEFSDLGVKARGRWPGFSGLDGYLYHDGGETSLRLATRDGNLVFPGVFRQPIAVRSLKGVASLIHEGRAWRISAEDVQLTNDDIQARANLRLRLPDRGAPFLDLQGAFGKGRAAGVSRYLPTNLMPATAVKWLDGAFKDGEIVSGTVLFHGRTDQFPFDGREGRFEVRFDARKVDLDYFPGWPRLTGVDGEVLFDGRRMDIHAKSARLMNGRVTDTTVSIPDLRRSRLHVQGRVEGALPDLMEYLRVTGLAGVFSETLARFRAEGGYGLDLQFDQPLGAGPPGRARGKLTFADGGLAVAPGVDFKQVNGDLSFDGPRYWSQGMVARLFDEPLNIVVAPMGEGETARTRVGLKGAVTAGALRRVAGSPLLTRMQGKTAWDAELLLAHSDAQESELRVQSPLTGMALGLPNPLEKSAEESRRLELAVRLSGPRKGEVEVALERGFAAAFALRPEGGLAKAAVHFGDGIPPLPEENHVRITGRLLALSPTLWRDALASAFPGASSRTVGTSKPLTVELDMEELRLIRTPPTTTASTSPPSEISAQRLPSLTVRIKKLGYESLLLGALSFRTRSSDATVELRDLSLVSPTYALSGKGTWHTGAAPQVRLDLKAKGRDLGAAADALAIASVVKKGDFEFESALSWPGNLDRLDLQRMEGTLKVGIKDGVLEEVEPGAGRLLGLLSLQALPRRLSLDFRDLFEKGMRFRSVDGTFTLKDGSAATDNLRMNALPAAVLVKGRTGYIRRDFDQVVTVVPDVSGSLPVAGGLALGPQIGAALLLIQQVFHKDINEASKFSYALTGSWDQPIIKRLDKKR